MAADLDEMVEGFRYLRRLDAGPYTFCWIDALTQKVREGGRTVNVHALIATGVNADGRRGILHIEHGELRGRCRVGWRSCAGLVARGLSPSVPGRDHSGDSRARVPYPGYVDKFDLGHLHHGVSA